PTAVPIHEGASVGIPLDAQGATGARSAAQEYSARPPTMTSTLRVSDGDGASILRTLFRTRLATLLAPALLTSAALAHGQTYTDGSFPASCWTSTKIGDTTPGASATFTSTTLPTGGNPADYRETSHTFANGVILVAHMSSCAIYDPSTTPICSIDFSYDL